MGQPLLHGSSQAELMCWSKGFPLEEDPKFIIWLSFILAESQRSHVLL